MRLVSLWLLLNMSKLALITNHTFLRNNLSETEKIEVSKTPYGEMLAPVYRLRIGTKTLVVLVRDLALSERIPPHKINYRANIHALNQLKVEKILSVSPANGIRGDLVPGSLVLPDQLIDYTHGRETTIFSDFSKTCNVDFREPYDSQLRQDIVATAEDKEVSLCEEATYGIIQGPRLTTLAELKRYERDGCDMLGMTGVPEPFLAKELGIQYCCLALITHRAAGKRIGKRDDKTRETLLSGINTIFKLVEAII